MQRILMRLLIRCVRSFRLLQRVVRSVEMSFDGREIVQTDPEGSTLRPLEAHPYPKGSSTCRNGSRNGPVLMLPRCPAVALIPVLVF